METIKTGDFAELGSLIETFCTERDWDQFHSRLRLTTDAGIKYRGCCKTGEVR